MAFPVNGREMEQQGYKFMDHGVCDGCGAPIEWWLTPRRRQIPMNPMNGQDAPAISHWATCCVPQKFKKKPGPQKQETERQGIGSRE
jgi:hypothetical protein